VRESKRRERKERNIVDLMYCAFSLRMDTSFPPWDRSISQDS